MLTDVRTPPACVRSTFTDVRSERCIQGPLLIKRNNATTLSKSQHYRTDPKNGVNWSGKKFYIKKKIWWCFSDGELASVHSFLNSLNSTFRCVFPQERETSNEICIISQLFLLDGNVIKCRKNGNFFLSLSLLSFCFRSQKRSNRYQKSEIKHISSTKSKSSKLILYF